MIQTCFHTFHTCVTPLQRLAKTCMLLCVFTPFSSHLVLPLNTPAYACHQTRAFAFMLCGRLAAGLERTLHCSNACLLLGTSFRSMTTLTSSAYRFLLTDKPCSHAVCAFTDYAILAYAHKWCFACQIGPCHSRHPSSTLAAP